MSAEPDNVSVDSNSEDKGFVRPPEKSIQDIIKADSQDPSLIKYKQELLGTAASGNAPIVLRPNDPNRVIVTKLSLVSGNEVKRSIEMPAADNFVLTIKEGCSYHIRIEYCVQREIVSGLRYSHRISRLGINVGRETYMFGSFAPRTDPYEYTSPAEEAPSGMLHRGKYSISSKVYDDDNHIYLKWNWTLEVVKDW